MTIVNSCYNIVITMQIQTVFKAGNSNVVTIPKSISDEVGIKKGSKVIIELAADGKTIVLSKAGARKNTLSITPEFLRTLERVNKRYGPALAKLAKL